VTGADRVTGGLDISRNGWVYAELAELVAPTRTDTTVHHPSSGMATLTMYPMFDYGELPASWTQSDGRYEAYYERNL
jgi:hypothetical protein